MRKIRLSLAKSLIQTVLMTGDLARKEEMNVSRDSLSREL